MKIITKILCLTMVLCILSACGKNSQSNPSNQSSQGQESNSITEVQTTAPVVKKVEFSPTLLPEERDSIKIGKLSSEHIYYQEVVTLDPECANYINEISIYDKEIDDTFVVHLSLPPNYSPQKKYPMVLMTDGVWRLSDHPELRTLMKNGKIEDVILVSVGYPNSYDYTTIRERDLVQKPDYYLHFLVDNLVPYLSEQYSIDSKKLTLTGHSYGGYWGFFALFNSDTIGKSTFANYYIGSPSFQASNTEFGFIEDFEKAYYLRKKELNCNVYVSVGKDEGETFINPITRFVNLLSERKYTGLNCTYDIIEGYDHNTVFKPSIKKTLQMYYGKK